MERACIYFKKSITILLFIVLFSSLYACKDKEAYKVIFDSNGGTDLNSINVVEGDEASEPTDPSKDGYTFEGWYLESDFINKYDFSLEVTEEITLYAKWLEGESETTEGPGLINVLNELPNDEEITISLWHSYYGSREELLDVFITEFEALYPNITIEADYHSSYGLMSNRVITSYVVGGSPQMVFSQQENVAEYIRSSLILPLDDFIYDENFGIDLTDFVDEYVSESKQFSSGNMYSLPHTKYTEMLVINVDKFENNGLTVKTDTPYTWSELDELADVLVGDGPNQCEYLINYDVSENLFTNSIKQWGTEYYNSDGDILVYNATTKLMMTYIEERFSDNTFVIPLAWSANYGSENFKAQDVCMTVGSSYYIEYTIPLNNEFEIAVGLVPQYDLENQSVFQQGANISLLSESTDEQRLASWLFMKYITSTENTVRWSLAHSYQPVRYSGYLSNDYQEFLNNPSLDDKYKSMAANAAYLQIENFKYDIGYVDGFKNTLSAKSEAQSAIEALFAGNFSVEEIIQEILNELG